MSETYDRLSPALDAIGSLPAPLTLPLAAVLYYLGRHTFARKRHYEAFFLLDAACRASGGRLLASQFVQIANLVELGQLDDALRLKRWADGALERQRPFNEDTRAHIRCHLNGLLPLHWHTIRQQPGEAVDPMSIDYRRVPFYVRGALTLNPKLVERFVPGATVRLDRDGVPVLSRAARSGSVPSIRRLSP